MRFLADMGISPRTVAELRQQGHDAVHLVEEGLERLGDGDILVKARYEGRILLTVDLDFAQLSAMSGEPFPSVILFRLGNVSREVLEVRLAEVLSQCAEDLATGAIVAVRDDAFRVRSLPI
jgi:predicted nuclease of predicted toxin-antitoxin system